MVVKKVKDCIKVEMRWYTLPDYKKNTFFQDDKPSNNNNKI